MVTKSNPGSEPVLPPTQPPPAAIPSSPPSKRDLASWWRQFKRNTRKEDPKDKPQGIFGVPLTVSIKYANVAISLTNDDGQSFIYGYVPIVVAKCGVFLKEKATDVEGIFRLNGSAKRIKDLQEIFDSPERYGKGLDWTGYTVHDAANVLRRYLNQLPEPIVPLDFYERFREPLRVYQKQVQNNEPATQPGNFDHATAVAAYQQLIRELPPLNKQLLLYILDLLAVFASKSDQNRMTSANLSAIFQPGLLSHPQHDMSPDEYKLSQDVLIFLIENQDHFLFGMNGTAADEQTVKDVEGGGLAPRPSNHSNIRRSVSSASAGADSFRKYENLRRNVSVSSKTSRQSNTTPGPATPTSLGGVAVHRSNTLPSKKSPAMRYGRVTEATSPVGATGAATPGRASAQHSRPSTPPQPQPQPETKAQPSAAHGVESATGLVYLHTATHGPVPKAESTASSTTPVPAATPVPVSESSATSPEPVAAPAPAPAPVATSPPATQPAFTEDSTLHETLSPPASPQPAVTPTKDRKLSSFFTKSPPSSSEPKEVRQPNRLKKKRIPGSASESAQSSSQSLQAATSETALSAVSPPRASEAHESGGATPKPTSTEEASKDAKQEKPSDASHHTDTTLRPYGSRTPSMNSRSSFTDYSDVDPPDESRSDRKEQRRSWRFHRTSKRSNEQMGLGLGSPPLLASNPGADQSTSSIGHLSSRSSPSDAQHLQDPAHQPLSLDAEVNNKETAIVSEPEKRSLFGKFKAKVAQVREGHKDERERTRSPVQSDPEKSASSQTLSPMERESIGQRPTPTPLDISKEVRDGPGTSSPASPHTGSGLPPAIPEEPRTPDSPVASSKVEPTPQPETQADKKVDEGGPKKEALGPGTLPTFESHKGDSETSQFLGN